MKNLNQNQKIAVVVGILIVGFFFVFGNTVMSVIRTGSLTSSVSSTTQQTNPQVVIQDVTVGTGDTAESGESITVNYIGTFTDGKIFDSSISRGEPFTFVLGTGQVIPGWDRGIVGMKVGGKRILVIPPELGYGPNDYGPIPGGSTLIFQVELLKVEK